MLANKASVGLGGAVDNVKSMAVDQDGNQYLTGTDGQFRKPLTEGVAVKVALDDADAHYRDVPRSVRQMQIIKVGAFIDPQTKGMITFKNVPVVWDAEPQ